MSAIGTNHQATPIKPTYKMTIMSSTISKSLFSIAYCLLLLLLVIEPTICQSNNKQPCPAALQLYSDKCKDPDTTPAPTVVIKSMPKNILPPVSQGGFGTANAERASLLSGYVQIGTPLLGQKSTELIEEYRFAINGVDKFQQVESLTIGATIAGLAGTTFKVIEHLLDPKETSVKCGIELAQVDESKTSVIFKLRRGSGMWELIGVSYIVVGSKFRGSTEWWTNSDPNFKIGSPLWIDMLDFTCPPTPVQGVIALYKDPSPLFGASVGCGFIQGGPTGTNSFGTVDCPKETGIKAAVFVSAFTYQSALGVATGPTDIAKSTFAENPLFYIQSPELTTPLQITYSKTGQNGPTVLQSSLKYLNMVTLQMRLTLVMWVQIPGQPLLISTKPIQVPIFNLLTRTRFQDRRQTLNESESVIRIFGSKRVSFSKNQGENTVFGFKIDQSVGSGLVYGKLTEGVSIQLQATTIIMPLRCRSDAISGQQFRVKVPIVGKQLMVIPSGKHTITDRKGMGKVASDELPSTLEATFQMVAESGDATPMQVVYRASYALGIATPKAGLFAWEMYPQMDGDLYPDAKILVQLRQGSNKLIYKGAYEPGTRRMGLNFFDQSDTILIWTVTIATNPSKAQKLTISFLTEELRALPQELVGCCRQNCPQNSGIQLDVRHRARCKECTSGVYSMILGACTCGSGLFLRRDVGTCLPCQSAFCQYCSEQTPSQCTTCTAGAVYTLETKACACLPGYFAQDNDCMACPHRCETCRSGLVCQTCADSSNRMPHTNCMCRDGFFDNGGIVCRPCNSRCLTCQNALTCTTCPENSVLIDNICLCQDGFYEMVFTDRRNNCQKCNSECKTCSNGPNRCKTCDADKFRVLGVDVDGSSICLCRTGYISAEQGNCIQVACTVDPNCVSCNPVQGRCLKCMASRMRVLSLDGTCVCKEGFFVSSITSECLPCKAGCKVCRSSQVCDQCIATATLSASNVCSCPLGKYINSINCSNCAPECKQCSQLNVCTECQTNFVMNPDTKMCYCPVGFYLTLARACLSCDPNCKFCLSSGNCMQCAANFVLQDGLCVNQCPNGYFKGNYQCQTCPRTCSTCFNQNTCLTCATGNYLNEGQCRPDCLLGYFFDSAASRCTPCQLPCATCIARKDYCTSCISGFLTKIGQMQTCRLSCFKGSYAQNDRCIACAPACSECFGRSTTCTGCAPGQYLYKSSCVGVCPGVLWNGKCVDDCPVGYFIENAQKCVPCALTCLQCSGSATYCTACPSGQYAVDGACSVIVPAGKFVNSLGEVITCISSCKSCLKSAYECTTCITGRFKAPNGGCYATCPQGTYKPAASGTCLPCQAPCNTCTSPTVCITCLDPCSYATDTGRCVSCDRSCAQCDDNNNCLGCSGDQVLFDGLCLPSCPFGSTATSKVCFCNSGIQFNGKCVTECPITTLKTGNTCQRCTQGCSKCVQKSTKCTSCLMGYDFDAAKFTCLLTGGCPYGTIEASGLCVRICQPGFFLYRNQCLYGRCPAGFYSNNNGGCIFDPEANLITSSPNAKLNALTAATSLLTQCEAGTYLHQKACVESCPVKYYPQTDTLTCDPCTPPCERCYSSTICSQCPEKYELKNGGCVSKLFCAFGYSLPTAIADSPLVCVSKCPSGTTTVGKTCKTICDSNLLYFDGYCVEQCFTSYKSVYACLNSCSSEAVNSQGTSIACDQ